MAYHLPQQRLASSSRPRQRLTPKCSPPAVPRRPPLGDLLERELQHQGPGPRCARGLAAEGTRLCTLSSTPLSKSGEARLPHRPAVTAPWPNRCRAAGRHRTHRSRCQAGAKQVQPRPGRAMGMPRSEVPCGRMLCGECSWLRTTTRVFRESATKANTDDWI